MSVAALVTWLITAVGGFVLLGTWISRGGARRDPGAAPSRFPPGLIFGHFLLAVVALVLWIIYLVADSDGLAWVSFALVVVVALLGFTMFFRWLPQARSRTGSAGADATAERHFPVGVVIAHGVFAAATLVLVLLAAITA
jgi:hypothetical protein